MHPTQHRSATRKSFAQIVASSTFPRNPQNRRRSKAHTGNNVHVCFPKWPEEIRPPKVCNLDSAKRKSSLRCREVITAERKHSASLHWRFPPYTEHKPSHSPHSPTEAAHDPAHAIEALHTQLHPIDTRIGHNAEPQQGLRTPQMPPSRRAPVDSESGAVDSSLCIPF